jgi:hypothetical protein
VVVKFDQRDRVYESGFTYVENPSITMEKVKQSTSSFDLVMNELDFFGTRLINVFISLQDKPLRGIPAGGINVTVEGRNFDVIQEPMIYVVYNGTSYLSVRKNTSLVGHSDRF